MTRKLLRTRLQRLPFRLVLTTLTTATVAFALALACVGLIGLQYFGDRSAADRRHEQIAKVIASNVGAAVVFGDAKVARENLSSVSDIPDIDWVQIATNDKRIFAAYSNIKVGADSPDTYKHVYPIRVDGEQIGELHMGVRYRSLMEIWTESALVTLLIFLACLVLAVFTARMLGRMAFRPLDNLANTMRNIARSGDYSLRLRDEPDPDFSAMVDSFNAMVDEISARQAELRETARALEVARDEAQQANVAKSQFLANMSHELRTPLNAIIGYTEVLREELVAAQMKQSVDDVQWIYGSARQLLELINGILDLSKIEAGRMDLDAHEFDVAALLREVGAMLEPIAAQKGNKLTLQIDTSVTDAFTDSTKLRQCLLNLGSNACKFTENGHIFILARQEEDDLIFSISDTGIGLSAEEMERLFQPFVQADASTTRRYGGTGLGLTISWRFAEMLGGRIDVDSASGEGSTFTLWVKANGAKIPTDAVNGNLETDNPFQVVSAARTGKPIAIIADDEPSALQLLTRLAEQSGYQVVTATDGEQCLQLAHAISPDLILLDIGMPKVDGWQVLDSLRHDDALSRIPTVVVTVDDDRRRILSAGASDHLVKPVRTSELVDIFEQYATRGVGRVLVVEDDVATAELYQRGIAQMGYDVQVCTDGQKALAAVHEGAFDCVVTDLRMPGLSGFDLVEGIGDMDSADRPLIFVVTGKVLNADEERQLEGKVVKLLPKNGLSPRKLAENVCFATVQMLNGQLLRASAA